MTIDEQLPPNPSVKAVFGKLKTLMKKGYNKLIQYKSGEATEKQDIDDIAPAIDSFYTQAAQFITTNTVSNRYACMIAPYDIPCHYITHLQIFSNT